MTIKEATKEMLWNIENKNTKKKNEEGKRGKDLDIARMLQITPASYSRLRNGLTEPKIMTWFKIVNLHIEMVGIGATENIISQVK